jgi:hypothetical protein
MTDCKGEDTRFAAKHYFKRSCSTNSTAHRNFNTEKSRPYGALSLKGALIKYQKRVAKEKRDSEKEKVAKQNELELKENLGSCNMLGLCAKQTSATNTCHGKEQGRCRDDARKYLHDARLRQSQRIQLSRCSWENDAIQEACTLRTSFQKARFVLQGNSKDDACAELKPQKLHMFNIRRPTTAPHSRRPHSRSRNVLQTSCHNNITTRFRQDVQVDCLFECGDLSADCHDILSLSYNPTDSVTILGEGFISESAAGIKLDENARHKEIEPGSRLCLGRQDQKKCSSKTKGKGLLCTFSWEQKALIPETARNQKVDARFGNQEIEKPKFQTKHHKHKHKTGDLRHPLRPHSKQLQFTKQEAGVNNENSAVEQLKLEELQQLVKQQQLLLEQKQVELDRMVEITFQQEKKIAAQQKMLNVEEMRASVVL